ncbi:variant erythrocyte surface antigen-1, beta subunit [Babesia caballi]|uniref:Variant erythrocyte surface antigen-1, beta subunit n=1 Tax=Babesia caballi TaxID=5871 RepID=A0AAV4LML0_BABCB|nr:variant erythrocyte surface antigen-1, beta subunit [Babesia caballi]
MGAQSSKAGTNGPFTCLTQHPRNLKEAVDWVLRFSGKDTSSIFPQGEHKTIGASAITCLAKAILKVLKEVDYDKLEDLKAITNEKALFSGDFKGANAKFCPRIILENLIDSLTESLRIFIGYDDKWEGTITGQGIAIGRNGIGDGGKREEPSPPWKSTTEKKGKREKGYVLAYSPDTAKWNDSWKEDHTYAQTCAKIFLTAVTLIFEGLTKLYWECRKGAQWSKEKFNEPTVVRLAGYLVSEGFELDGLYLTYFPIQEEIRRSGNKLKQRDNEGGSINGVLAYAFEEFSRVMIPPPEPEVPSTWRTPNSYKDFVKALLDRAKNSSDKFNKIKEMNYCDKYCKTKTACTKNCETLRRSDAYSTFLEYPITKVYILAVAYRTAAERCYQSTVFKAVGGVTCGAGIGTAAYFTNVFGFGPMIAGFFY